MAYERVPGAAKILYDSGLLAEINRIVLHPRGLALEVDVDEATGEVKFTDALHKTDDIEGMEFDAQTLEGIVRKLDAQHKYAYVSVSRRKLYPPDGVQPLPRVKLED